MSGATSRCEAGSTAPGVAEVTFQRRGERTVLTHLFQQAPLRVLFPRSEDPDTPVAALVSTSGGLVGGDRALVRVRLERNASAVVMSGAAEKVYRSSGGTCQVRAELSVQEGGRLDYLPHETIVFDAARVDRTTVIDLAPECRVLAGGMLVFGRSASGEVLSRGYIRDAWEIRMQGRLLWADALLMEDNLLTPFAAVACLKGAAAIATMIFAGDNAATQIALARDLLKRQSADDDMQRSGATMVAGLIIVRWIGADAHRLRAVFGAFLAAFRHLAADREPALPRLWSV